MQRCVSERIKENIYTKDKFQDERELTGASRLRRHNHEPAGAMPSTAKGKQPVAIIQIVTLLDKVSCGVILRFDQPADPILVPFPSDWLIHLLRTPFSRPLLRTVLSPLPPSRALSLQN